MRQGGLVNAKASLIVIVSEQLSYPSQYLPIIPMVARSGIFSASISTRHGGCMRGGARLITTCHQAKTTFQSDIWKIA